MANSVWRSDVVLVDFPYPTGQRSKVRPALVVQNDKDNVRLLNTILAQITGTMSCFMARLLLPHVAGPATMTTMPSHRRRSPVMSRATLEERVAVLERQVGALLANHAGTGRAKDWRRTRGVFTGDDLMKQVFEEGRKIRDAERKRSRSRSRKKRQVQS